MASYNNYKMYGRSISDILEDSAGRYSSLSGMNNYNVADSKMTFALYYSIYHPFLINTEINRYYQNGIATTNKGYIHKGGAPLLNERSNMCVSHHQVNKIIYSYKGTGNGLDGGTLYCRTWYTDEYGEHIMVNQADNCPSSIILGIMGAGGGGAGGGGWYTGKYSYGGGCGPLLILNLELPYKETEEVNVLRIDPGAGGAGGGPWSNGSNGGQTKVYMWSKTGGYFSHVATLNGGKGGQNVPYGTGSSGGTTLAITTVNFEYPINVTTYSNGDGYGKLTINQSCRSFSWGSGTYAYMPGNYYSTSSENDNYNQAAYYSPQITSGVYTSQAYLYKGGYTNGYGEKGSLFATNRMFYGKSSIYGQGGAYANNGNGNGSNGVWGSGGGGGGSAQNGFDGGIGSGGRGGSAGVKVYW